MIESQEPIYIVLHFVATALPILTAWASHSQANEHIFAAHFDSDAPHALALV